MSKFRFDQCKNVPGVYEIFQRDLADREEAERNKGTVGLGDIVAVVTRVTRIDKVVKAIVGEADCGCNNRQKKLNKIRIPNPFHKDDGV